MRETEKEFFVQIIKSSVKTIADGSIFSLKIDEEINEYFPKISCEERKSLKTEIILMSAALILIYEIDRKHLESKINYGRNFSKQDKKEEIDYISNRFGLNLQLVKKRIRKNIKLLKSLGKVEKKTPKDMEKRIKKLLELDENLF